MKCIWKTHLTREEALAYAASGWYEGKSAEDIVAFQLFEERCCLPFEQFHAALEAVLGRTVEVVEFGRDGYPLLQREYLCRAGGIRSWPYRMQAALRRLSVRKAIGAVGVVAMIFLVAVTLWNDAGLRYNGIYIDLIAQAKQELPLKEGQLQIRKIDSETGYAICDYISYGNIRLMFPTFIYQGEPLQLRFENDVLTGCREYTKMSLEDMLADQWDTDPQLLRSVLADYAAQVQALETKS